MPSQKRGRISRVSATRIKPRTAPKQRPKGRVAAAGAQEAPKPDASTIAGRLVICRMARKLKKAHAARKIGITPQSLGGLESGKSKQPAADTLLDMRDKVGYDPDYVIRGRGMPLLPNFEEQAQELALIALYRELHPTLKATALRIITDLRRTTGRGSANDPYGLDPPETGD